jgi:hypothetical protein
VKNKVKNQNGRKKPEPGNPVPSREQIRQRVREFPRTSGSLPDHLDDWLHAEAAFKVGENLSATIRNHAA